MSFLSLDTDKYMITTSVNQINLNPCGPDVIDIHVSDIRSLGTLAKP